MKCWKAPFYKYFFGGNDLRAVFLTDDMYKAIIQYPGLSEKEKPQVVPEVFK